MARYQKDNNFEERKKLERYGDRYKYRYKIIKHYNHKGHGDKGRPELCAAHIHHLK
ncbi:Uncharacterised protein [uncultured archaeon]|nr:Uncharacterised protein [uncultured archaeon]